MNHFLPDCGSEGVRNREELKLSHQESMSTVESGQSGGVERAARWQSAVQGGNQHRGGKVSRWSAVQRGNQYKVAISTRWQSVKGGKVQGGKVQPTAQHVSPSSYLSPLSSLCTLFSSGTRCDK